MILKIKSYDTVEISARRSNLTLISKDMLNINNKRLLLVIILVFMSADYLIYEGYSNEKAALISTTNTINDQILKRRLLTTMYKSARERAVILLKMLNEEDAFVLDDLGQKLGEQARNFLRARKELFKLSLSYTEQRILSNQRLVSMNTAPKTDRVAALLLEGRRDEAKKVLIEEAIPGQNEVLLSIQLTIDEYDKKSAQFVEKINHDFEKNSQIFQVLALLLAVASIIVILIVMTRLSRQEEKRLKDALDQARARAIEARESEEYLQAVMDNIGERIIAIDNKGYITSFNSNAQNIFGYTEEQAVGSNVAILMPEADRKAHKKYTDNSRLSYSRIIGRNRDLVGQRKDGSQFPMELHVTPITKRNKEGFVGVMKDISERVETEKSLRRAQKMQAVGQLTGGIAHDFNNILSIIFGNLYLLKREISDHSSANELVSNIKQTSERAADLIKQLLGFSRNKVEQEIVSNVNHLIAEMRGLIERSITPENIVENYLNEDLWLTKIDPGDFQDSLLNLVINARDAMTGNGKILLKTVNVTLDSEFCARHSIGVPGEYVKLIVSDTGAGIPSEILERIFDPFFTTKEVGKGSGLGLAMVYGFVQRSGGCIHVDSIKNQGTSFQLYLPRSHEEMKSENTIKMDSGVLPEGSETILMVDDDKSLLDTTTKLLQLQGYKVLTSGNGQHALEILAKEPDIKLLFSDVVMPGELNGYMLAKKATIMRPDLKVLLTSGFSKYASEKDINKGEQQGITGDLLSKPYTAMQLMQKIREILDAN